LKCHRSNRELAHLSWVGSVGLSFRPIAERCSHVLAVLLVGRE
jgi:hypothetical protein